MQLFLANKNIIVGVTGSIAAYKSADLVRRLREVGANVRVVMTENAKRFITPLTMQAVSGFPVHDDLFDLHAEAAMGHIELARWADLILVAPATADFMARFARGLGDDLLTTLCLATDAKIALAPAMNQGMWKYQLTQENLQALQQKEVAIFGPISGSQACGDMGPGRMMEPLDLVKETKALFETKALAGIKVLITAGPTHEAIDPIRFITNGSTGKMGYALAEAAREAGARVTLISGPTILPQPPSITTIPVVTAMEMYDSVMVRSEDCDIFIGVAAVSDYRSEIIAEQKIPKEKDQMTLSLIRNPDILASVAKLKHRPFVVGFAAETDNIIAKARNKLENKRLDMVVANRVNKEVGFGSDENNITVISKKAELNLSSSKAKLARQLIAMIAEQYQQLHPIAK